MLSIVFDIAILAVIVIFIAVYINKGFVSGIINFIGVFVAFIGSYILARYISGPIFNTFLRSSLAEKVSEILLQNGNISFEEIIHSVAAFIPLSLVNLILADVAPTLENAGDNMAASIVDLTIAPVIIPLIAFVVFILCFLIVKAVVKVVAKMFRGINEIPLVGGVNKALGSIMGILIGLVYAFLAIAVVWTLDAALQGTFTAKYLPNSFVLGLMENYNFYGA